MRRWMLVAGALALVVAGVALAAPDCAISHCVYLPAVQYNPPPTALPTNTPLPVFPLINGDFEQGRDVGWASNETSLFFGVRQGNARTGSWFADLGSNTASLRSIAQQITITPSAPYLVYWYTMETDELQCTFDVGVVSLGNNTVDQVEEFCKSKVHGYRKHALDLRPYIGQTLTLDFTMFNDSTLASYWHIDDVSLQPKP